LKTVCGVCRNFYTCINFREIRRKQGCKPFSGGVLVQFIPQRPEYPADFAVYITLKLNMSTAFTVVSCLGLALVIANVWVSADILRNAMNSRVQMACQCAIVWLLPVFGAAIIWSFMRSEVGVTSRTNGQDDQGVSGPEFDRPGLSHGIDP
jgi:hypothetical protein